MIRRPPRSTLSSSSAASDVYKRQGINAEYGDSTENAMSQLSSLKKLVEQTCTPNTPCQLVEVEGLKELIQYIRKANNKRVAILDILKHLKPYVKSDYPKPILAGLKVIEMLMIQIGKVFCDEVSSEEWTRRLRKLVVKTKEPILRMTVLQHLADWVEMFGMISDITWLNKVNNEIQKEYNIPMPGPSANARDHAKRLRDAEQAKVAEAQAAATPAPAPAPAPAEEARTAEVEGSDNTEVSDSDSDDTCDRSDRSEEDPVEELTLRGDVSSDANAVLSKLRSAAHELRAFRMVHRSSSGKLKRRLERKSEKLAKLEARMEDPDKVEFMRTVNRELADAQRQLLNLQYTWTTMESEVQELEWAEEKGVEELEAIEKQHQKLSAEAETRRAEEKETLDELDQGAKDLQEAESSNKHYFGEGLAECEMAELEEMKATIKKTLALLA
eukprot:TRINITY_DN6939_c0_g1_i4.p1 TRINITY_DN6939_c0_g1~~TRINITY_DN6939_c0_g1_i4.p1  ORF type:complete len:443 (+),score=165.31 TRINITY_DN6939_c0_g1_i4:67-1395(+)